MKLYPNSSEYGPLTSRRYSMSHLLHILLNPRLGHHPSLNVKIPESSPSLYIPVALLAMGISGCLSGMYTPPVAR